MHTLCVHTHAPQLYQKALPSFAFVVGRNVHSMHFAWNARCIYTLIAISIHVHTLQPGRQGARRKAACEDPVQMPTQGQATEAGRGPGAMSQAYM
jgi:hypothetical protein